MNDFGNKFKILRKNRNLTQEEIAEILGVTFQAISKWETDSAMPDISMLPIIANFFEVTTDELLGVDITRVKQKIDKYEKEINQLYNNWKLDDGIKLAKQILIEFPNNYQIMICLCHGLWHLGIYDELIELCKKILEKDTDVSRKNKALEYLIFCYSKRGNKEEALKLAYQLPTCHQAREHMIIKNNLKPNEEKYKYISLVICHYLSNIETALEKFADVCCIKQYIGDSPLSIDERIKVLEKLIEIYKVLYEDENYMVACADLYFYYETIASLYLMNNDNQKVLDNLEKAYDFAEKFHLYNEEDVYTSLLFRGINPNPQSLYNRTMFESMYEYLTNSDRFNIVKDEIRFQNIIEKLKTKIKAYY